MMVRRTFIASLLALLGGGGWAKADPLLDLMEARALPCVLLQPGSGPPVGQLGGRPNLADRHAWPDWNGAPQAFLAQLDLAALRRANGPEWLPERGALFFFYDAEQSTWGFDPADRGSWRVIYDPEGFDVRKRPLPARLPKDARFRERPLGGRPARSLPDAELVGAPPPDVDTPAYDAYEAKLDANAPDGPWHQVGGHPAAIQSSSMALESQLASNGVYVGGPEGYGSPEAKRLEAGAKDWLLLLQIDSDDDAGMMWGDLGRLYFWIREDDARRSDFKGAWMVCQMS